MRMMTLEAEPVIARFVTEQVQVLAPGAAFDLLWHGISLPRPTEDSTPRPTQAADHVAPSGFPGAPGSGWFVSCLPRSTTPFIVVLHARFAPSPRIVRLSDILSSPFWRYLGLRAPDDVRAILRDAEAAGLISRYVTVDELEQITTRYTVAEYLESALRL